MQIVSLNFFALVLLMSLIYNVFFHNHKLPVLSFVSVLFYSLFDFHAAILLIASSMVDFKIALMIYSTGSRSKKKKYLILSIIINVVVLIVFKYLQPVGGILLDVFDREILEKSINIIQPLGISFYTFKKISYVVDVYRGIIKPEEKLFVFITYVVFFLEIFSGPIHRAHSLIPQLRSKERISFVSFEKAALYLLLGLLLKLVVADRLAVYTDTIFNDPQQYKGWTLILATYFYAFQIYADFAGYTLIIIGFGKLFSINIPQNFNLPYWANNINDFWRRWHITLSTWLRDYLYIPLGGNRVSKMRLYGNYLIVFLLCGLWHGANITFVIWGALHGIFLIITSLLHEVLSKKEIFSEVPKTIQKAFMIVVTFHMVTFAWIFFRANSLSDAFYIIANLFSTDGNLFVDENSISYGIVAILALLFTELLIYTSRLSISSFLNYKPVFRGVTYYLIIFSIILASVEKESTFIYVQF